MISVFLIDDEQLILEGLQQIIDWNQLGFRLSGCYTRAKQAVDEALKKKPDIVITDIRMPGLSGLELISALKAALPDTLYVVLSAYDSFQYAQKALHLGAFRYLLKPIEQSDLVAVLQEARRVLASKKSFDFAQVERKQPLRDWLTSGLLPIQWKDDMLLENKLDQDHVHLCFCHVPLMMDERFFYEPLSESEKQTIFETIQTVCQPQEQFYDQSFFVAVLPGDQRPDERLENHLTRQIWMKLRREACVYKTVDPISIKEGNAMFQDLSKAFLDHVFFAQKPLAGQKPSFKSSQHIQLEMVKALSQADHGRIDDVFHQIEQESGADRYAVLSLYEALVAAMEQYCETLDQNYQYTLPKVSLDHFLTRRDLAAYARAFVLKEVEKISYQYGSNKVSLISRAKIFIEMNYTDPTLTLLAVAESLYINYSYLSHVFNTETGQTFNDYVANIRIEKAKTLLTHAPLSVQAVADRVGYADSKHFCRVFKKKTGYTPLQYRQFAPKDNSFAE